MASAVICLSKGQRFNFSRYIFDSLVRNVDSSSKFYMYPRFIQMIIQAQVVDLSSYSTRYISPALTQKVFANMRRVGKEINNDVATPTSPLPSSPIVPPSPLHQSSRASPSQAAEGTSILVQQVLEKCFALIHRVEGLESANTAQQLEILKLKARVKKLERLNKGRISVDIDEGIELVDDQEKDDQEKDVQVKGRQAYTQAKIYNIDLDHTSKVLSMQEDSEVQEVVEVVNAAKLITEVVTAATTQVIPAANPVVTAVSTPISAVKPKKVFANMKRIGKGFSGVETPLFENMLAVRAVDAEEEVQVPAQDDVVQENVIEEVAAENANAAQKVEILKLKAKVKKLERLNKVKSSKLRCLKKVGTSQRIKSSEDVENVFNQGRMSVDMETNEEIELEVDQEKDAQVEGRHADTQAKIYNIDLDHSSKGLSMQEDTEVQEAVKVVTTAKLITEVVTAAATQVAAASTPIPAAKPKVLKIAAAALAVSTRRRKGIMIRDPEEELHDDTLAETPTVKDKGKGILIEDPKPMKKKDQIEMDAEFKKKPQSESEAHKNMISYLKNTEGFKMEFFKGKTYDQILPIFQTRFDANMKFLFKTREEMEKEDEEIIKSINETPAQKAAKRRKPSEEVQEADNLRGRLEIVLEEDDDVFVEAVPLAQKAPVVDYQVVVVYNRPKYKIIRADDTH
nr:hypothetical protein [Tanacetum cinerariifolium]